MHIYIYIHNYYITPSLFYLFIHFILNFNMHYSSRSNLSSRLSSFFRSVNLSYVCSSGEGDQAYQPDIQVPWHRCLTTATATDKSGPTGRTDDDRPFDNDVSSAAQHAAVAEAIEAV